MKSPKAFIFEIVRKTESLRDGLIAYAYAERAVPSAPEIWWICVSDYDFYREDQRFKVLCKAWHKAARARGINLSIVYCNPLEKKLNQLSNDDNLILNV